VFVEKIGGRFAEILGFNRRSSCRKLRRGEAILDWDFECWRDIGVWWDCTTGCCGCDWCIASHGCKKNSSHEIYATQI
jgi:hypothetical protein